jgi:hypothetical protein
VVHIRSGLRDNKARAASKPDDGYRLREADDRGPRPLLAREETVSFVLDLSELKRAEAADRKICDVSI